MQGQTRAGSFDTLRLLAALAVFHSHSFALVGMREPGLPGYTLGGVAVIVFFAMSGYWVSRSALERSLASYAVARAVRIVPGLFVCCLVTIGLCALATSEVVNDYFRSKETWLWLQNAFPFWVPQRGELPGVFEDGAVANPNGSLWTLPYEVFCYVLAACAAVFGSKGMRAAVFAAGVFAIAVVFAGDPERSLELTSSLNLRWLAVFGAAFFLGAWLTAVDDRALLKLAAVSAFALVIAHRDPAITPLACIGLFGSLAIWVGRNLDLDARVTRGWDVSYGVYIYAFPLTQLSARAIEPKDGVSFALYWAAALAGTLVLAWLSWTLVEKPSLRLKKVLSAPFERLAGMVQAAPKPARAAG